MSPSRVSEYERWPDSARKPSVYALAVFAELYGTRIGCLIDAADLEQMNPTERTAVLGPGAAPLPLLRRTVGLRNRVLDLLGGQQHVDQIRELYAVAGKIRALLAWMSVDFAQHSAARVQADAAWVFAEQAGQHAVRASVRITQARTAYWLAGSMPQRRTRTTACTTPRAAMLCCWPAWKLVRVHGLLMPRQFDSVRN